MKTIRKLCWIAALLAATALAQAQSLERYSFSNLNKPIPDGSAAGVSDVQSVTSGIPAVSEVRVKLKIAGKYNGDLYAYLRRVNAQTTNFCVLLNRVGKSSANTHGYSDAGIDVTFDGAAPNDIHTYRLQATPAPQNPLTGSWQPDGRNVDPYTVLDTSVRTTTLGNFTGRSGSGDWTLFVADVDAGGANQLVSWELELNGASIPPVAWAPPANITYGTALGSAQLNASSGGVPGTFSYSPASGTVLNAGSNQMLSATFTPNDLSAYARFTTNVPITVLKAPLTVTAQNKSKVYGAALPSLTAAYSGFVLGQGVTDLDSPATVATTAAPSSPAGSYPITASGATDLNYQFTYVSGTLLVNKASLAGTLASSRNPSLPGQQVTFTHSLTPVAPGAGAPSGTVQFRIDGQLAGSVPLINSAASFNAAPPLGTHTVAAEYPGDGNFFGVTNLLATPQLVNTPPIAAPDTVERYEASGVKVEIAALLGNDSDADGDPLTFQGTSPTSVAGGIVSRQDNWIYYQPPAGFTGNDSFTYTISDGRGGPVTGTVNINIKQDGPAMNLTIFNIGNGSFRLRFDGISSRTCVIQYSASLTPSNWLFLTNGVTDSAGLFECIDTPPASAGTRYYRSLFP